jgi:hypothetical protein
LICGNSGGLETWNGYRVNDLLAKEFREEIAKLGEYIYRILTCWVDDFHFVPRVEVSTFELGVF